MGFFGGENKFPVKGRTVLLTGGSQGMGRCVGRILAEKGANVVIVARTTKKLQDSIQYISEGATDKSSQRFHYISADLKSASEASRVLSETQSWNRDSPPDIVWCCHGNSAPMLLTDTPVATLEDQMATNYFSNLYLARAAFQAWTRPEGLQGQEKKKETQHLVFTSSLLAFLPIIGYAPYSPAKAALRSLADTLSMEARLYRSANIRVHTVFPATIFTEGYEVEMRTKPDVTKKLEEDDGGQTPEEVARVSLRGLESGDELVHTTFMARLAMAGMFGITRRNGFVVFDLLLSWLAVLLFPFIRLYLNSQVDKWGRENDGSGMKKEKKGKA